jgi:hypothetical protein
MELDRFLGFLQLYTFLFELRFNCIEQTVGI